TGASRITHLQAAQGVNQSFSAAESLSPFELAQKSPFELPPTLVPKMIANVSNMYRLNIQHLVKCIWVGLGRENGSACPFLWPAFVKNCLRQIRCSGTQ
ncbi:MAG: hypothetical protein QOJ40_1564, partial [Verrucomicrobiota bacterium]